MTLKTLILFLLGLNFASSQTATCTYSIRYGLDMERYQCHLSINNPNGLDNAVSIGGVHSGSSTVDPYGNLISTYDDLSVLILTVVGTTKNMPSVICRQFPNLEQLHFYNSKTEIASATKCSKLKELHLSKNLINESSIVDFCQYQPALTTIYLDNNKLRTIPDIAVKSCKNLKKFNADDNQITAFSSTFFANTPTIASISIGGNPMSVIPNGIFNGLTELDTLNMRDLLIADLPINIFSTNTKLTTLTLSNNTRLTQYRPEWFQNLKQLENLFLDHNNKAPIPANFFQPMPLLRNLFMENCNISVVYPQWFSSLKSLFWLKLRQNTFTEIADGVFANTNLLYELDISNNKLKTIESKWFTNATLPKIRTFYADDCEVNAIDSTFFQQARDLQFFSLLNSTCYNGRIKDFYTNRSTYMPGFQTCINNYGYLAV